MLDLTRFERGVCECGYHESLTSDPVNHYTPTEKVCPVCKGYAQFLRIQSAADEEFAKNLGEKPPPGTPRPSDGRRTVMRLMSPAELEARRASSLDAERGQRRTSRPR